MGRTNNPVIRSNFLVMPFHKASCKLMKTSCKMDRNTLKKGVQLLSAQSLPLPLPWHNKEGQWRRNKENDREELWAERVIRKESVWELLCSTIKAHKHSHPFHIHFTHIHSLLLTSGWLTCTYIKETKNVGKVKTICGFVYNNTTLGTRGNTAKLQEKEGNQIESKSYNAI